MLLSYRLASSASGSESGPDRAGTEGAARANAVRSDAPDEASCAPSHVRRAEPHVLSRVEWYSLAAPVRTGIALCVTVSALAACKDFSPTAPVPVTLGAADWPEFLLVTETDTFEVTLDDEEKGALSGVPLGIQMSDRGVLVVVQLKDESGHWVNQLQVSAVATGEVVLTLELPGGFTGPALSRTVASHMKWIAVDAGYEHTCGVTFEGAAYCWGGAGRLLGDGSSNPSAVPSAVVGAFRFGAISAGFGHSCATLTGGLMTCWGYNLTGALGTGNVDDQLVPTTLRFGATLLSFRAGHQYTCGLSGTSTAVCWGDNRFGQLGAADATDLCGINPCSPSPVAVQSPAQRSAGVFPRFADVSAGDQATCGVLLGEGSLACWGDNTYGLLGSLSVSRSDTAVVIFGDAPFRTVSTGRFHACAISDQNEAYCWGTNSFGELGVASTPDRCGGLPCSRSLVRAADAPGFVAVSVGEHLTCAVSDADLGYCWGLNDAGQLGSETVTRCSGLPCSPTPVAIAGPEDDLRFRVLSAGQRHACGLTTRGGAFCWGEGREGKLGNGSAANSSVPRRVQDPS